MFATMTGLMLAVLLAALDKTLWAQPNRVSSLSSPDSTAIPGFPPLIYSPPRWRFPSSPSYPTCTAGNGFSSAAPPCSCPLPAMRHFGTLTFLPLDGMNQLIVFRGLQGIGAGMMIGLGFTIIGDVFSRPSAASIKASLPQPGAWLPSSDRLWAAGSPIMCPGERRST